MTAHSWEDGRTPELDAVRRDDALLDALAKRRTAACESRLGGSDPRDPAAELLGALVADVHADPIGEWAAVRPVPTGGRRGQARRLPRTFVALSVTTAVLATTGVAAAAGGLTPFSSASGSRETIPHPHLGNDHIASAHPGRTTDPRHSDLGPGGQSTNGGAPPENRRTSDAPRGEPTSPSGGDGGSQPSNTPDTTPATPPTTPTPTPTRPSFGPNNQGGGTPQGHPSKGATTPPPPSPTPSATPTAAPSTNSRAQAGLDHARRVALMKVWRYGTPTP